MYNILLLPFKIIIVFIFLLFIRGLLPRLKINDLIEFWWKYILVYTFMCFFLNMSMYYIIKIIMF